MILLDSFMISAITGVVSSLIASIVWALFVLLFNLFRNKKRIRIRTTSFKRCIFLTGTNITINNDIIDLTEKYYYEICGYCAVFLNKKIYEQMLKEIFEFLKLLRANKNNTLNVQAEVEHIIELSDKV